MSIEIISNAVADTDYTIAVLDGTPIAVVEESDGGYYAEMSPGEYIYNRYEQSYWYVDDDGEWVSSHADPSTLVDVMEGLRLRVVNDGDQEVYDGDLWGL